MLWGIDWRIVQRMLIDGPKFETNEKAGNEDEVIDLTEETSEEMMAKLNKIFT